MAFPFYKYQGTGNDFVIIDNRQLTFSKNDTKLIELLCDRKFGIGADGLILLENHPKVNFKMTYFNADGRESTMCGNGGRCIVAFAKKLEIIENKATFQAIDGMHSATIKDDIVSLQMNDVCDVRVHPNHTFLNTGSPHHVQMTASLDELDVQKEGAAIRYSSVYGSEGSNVNFVTQTTNGGFSIRTYERGVEDETLSCGTGATAVAISMHRLGLTDQTTVAVKVRGGDLSVRFEVSGKCYQNVYLEGPATFVFKGEWQ